jgi:protein-tyrosine phosphatase
MSFTGETGNIMRVIASARRRHIPLPGTLNLRDVGGYPAAGGGTVRWRLLLRSDAVQRLDDDGAAALHELNLRTVIDLRTPAEVEIAPSLLAALGTRRLHAPLLRGDLAELPAELSEIYQYMADECGQPIGQAVRAVGAAGALPALIHCTAGKDRTGIVVALILACAGVPDPVIAADYALSGSYLDPETAAAIGRTTADRGLGDRIPAGLLASPPELILQVLARIRSRWGSVDGYLIEHGVPPGDLARLRTELVEYPG